MPSDEEFLLYPLDTGQGPARLVWPRDDER
jgi:hypothetical protein